MTTEQIENLEEEETDWEALQESQWEEEYYSNKYGDE